MTKRVWNSFSKIIIVAFVTFLTHTPSHANSLEQTRQLLDQGQFDQAAEMGQTIATAQGLTLAAEAIAAPVLLGKSDNQRDRAKAALKLAEAAVGLDPNSVEARLQVALALGFVTRASNPITVWRKGLAVELKDAIAAHQNLAPNDARGHALLGAWHYGIIRKAGEKRGHKWYDATLIAGNAAYDKALQLAPNDIIIKTNYALSLVDDDYDAHQVTALNMLEAAINIPAQSALETAVQSRMKTIVEDWDNKKDLRIMSPAL